jgi:diguanylate cyclase (GGDEF)-like protein
MSDPFAGEAESTQALRSLRLVQVSNLVITALLVAAVIYVLKKQWAIVVLLAAAIFMMLASQVISRRGRNNVANILLLSSLTAMSSGLMWVSEGVHDITILTYPVILILAGLLVNVRVYIALLVFMLLYVLGIAFVTEALGWRRNAVISDGYDTARDAALVLLVSGYAVWMVVGDLQKALARLKLQIVKYHESQKHLTYLSQHDALTGLPNRAMGRDRIEQAIANAERHKIRAALLFVDLDNFKSINDTLGHAAGDEFLKQVALRLNHSVRRSDIVARHGGDEFVIGLTDVADIDDASTAAGTILTQLAKPFLIRDAEFTTSCSIGIAMYPDDGTDYETLLKQSDIAMYQAKESGRNTVRFYAEAMNVDIKQNLLTVSNLRTALARREFVLHYQPVVNLVSGQLVGAEALIRWQPLGQELVAPAAFIPAAEKSGLIVEIGAWVLDEACRQLASWQQEGLEDFVMAVNLSAVQFRRGDIDKVVADALRRSGLRAGCLELEITESTLVQDNATFMQALQNLKALGVKISIDDFGTGYSNLSYLQRFAVNRLKIDRSFVTRLRNGAQDRAIVNAIIQMARSLDLETTAEGIEDEAVRQELIALGCEQGQGYLFARPQPAAQFEHYLRTLQEKAY